MPALAQVTPADANLALVLKVLPALVVLLIAAAVCGRLAQLVMQPRVLGEMVAGVLLGPTLFGWLFPGAQAALFPPEVRPILYVLSTIGLTLYMFLVGAGIDHGGAQAAGEVRRAGVLAAAVDDALAWCVLAVLSALHLSSSPGGAVPTIGLTIAFAVVMLKVVAPMLRPLGRSVARTGKLGATGMYVVILVPLTAGWLTDWIGVYSVFGGFIAGLAMPRDPKFREVLHGRMMEIVSTLLLPAFFTFSGLNTQLGGIAGGAMLLAFATILLAGFAGKYFGCSLSMKASSPCPSAWNTSAWSRDRAGNPSQRGPIRRDRAGGARCARSRAGRWPQWTW